MCSCDAAFGIALARQLADQLAENLASTAAFDAYLCCSIVQLGKGSTKRDALHALDELDDVLRADERTIRRPRKRLVAGTIELSNLKWVCGDVPLVTLHDPDIGWREERSIQSKRGQQQKGNKGGRPVNNAPGYKKRRRELLDIKVLWLARLGLSVRASATMLEEHPTQIQRSRNRLRGR